MRKKKDKGDFKFENIRYKIYTINKNDSVEHKQQIIKELKGDK